MGIYLCPDQRILCAVKIGRKQRKAIEYPMKHLLIVEDDETLRTGLCRALSQDDVVTHGAGTLLAAEQALAKEQFDLIVLDCQLPDGNGVEFCARLYETSNIPVIFLTVLDSELDEVAAFRAGGYDYVKKPFSLVVLQERIRAVLDRRKTSPLIYHENGYYFNFAEFVFCVDEQEITLSTAEQKLLQILVANKKQVVSRERLIERLWSCDGDFVDENALSVAVKRLRAKLDRSGKGSCIRTIYGLGYMFCGGEVTRNPGTISDRQGNG